MRVVFVLLVAAVCALAVPVTKPQYKVADKAFLEKQKEILRLFYHVGQPSYYKDIDEVADAFKFEGNWAQWVKPEYAKEFYHYYEHDILPQGEVFSVFYPEHLKQAIALFKTLYYAKDWETFYRVACWARQNVNEGMYVYALSVATVHSKYTQNIVLPPIYEIYPHYFFNDEVIYKAQQYKQHYWGAYEHEHEYKDADYKGYTIPANYSGWYVNVHPEQSMTYFTEDIGVNSYYYYRHIFLPFWMSNDEISYDASNRGEYYLWANQQLLARYYLERLSNGFGEIPHFEYEYPIETGYYPSLTYANGLKFPTRSSHANLYYHGVHGQQSYPHYGNYTYSYTYVKDYERRLRDALDRGYIFTQDGKIIKLFDENGLETLGRLIESNADSPNGRYYGDLLIFSRHLLGYSFYPLDQYKAVPSAMEHYETSLRDPMFWQMYKRIMHYYYQHQNYEGPYEQEELYWQGVKIEEITVDRLITYFERYHADLTNAVTVDEKEFQEHSFQVRARQYRLNHKPFNYKISVASDKQVDAFVKVFIGPKYDEFGRDFDMDTNRENFVELDRFQYTLQAGKNVIERNSRESFYYGYDRTTYKQLYEKVMTSLNGGDDFKIYPQSFHYGFPQRHMLPKGDFGGQTYQFYAIVVPYHSSKSNEATEYFVDTEYSMGYPFDRPVEIEDDFYVPNSYFKDVVIYHKNTEEDINTTWSRY